MNRDQLTGWVAVPTDHLPPNLPGLPSCTCAFDGPDRDCPQHGRNATGFWDLPSILAELAAGRVTPARDFTPANFIDSTVAAAAHVSSCDCDATDRRHDAHGLTADKLSAGMRRVLVDLAIMPDTTAAEAVLAERVYAEKIAAAGQVRP